MGFFDKKKNTAETSGYTDNPVEEVFGSVPKSPANSSVNNTAKPNVKSVPNDPIKQAPQPSIKTYGYGPEEEDIYLNTPYGVDPYHLQTSPIKTGEKNDAWYRIYVPKPLYEKRSAIIFVVESSEDTLPYNADISRLISKIVTDNKNEFFKFIRLGNGTKFFELISGEQLTSSNISSSVLLPIDNAVTKFDIYDILKHIDNFVREYLTLNKVFDVNTKKYRLEDARIIFIGTGKTDESSNNTRFLLKSLCNNKKIKTIKYFCLKDEHTINVAAIGFPVIGHIESNFYK